MARSPPGRRLARGSQRGLLGRGGWIAVRLTDGRYEEARFFPEFDALLRAFPTATAITVDIPIGLPVRGRRRADLEAKRVLESLRNSVFFVPPRPALEAPTFEEAVRIARGLDSSISQQIYGLRHTHVRDPTRDSCAGWDGAGTRIVVRSRRREARRISPPTE